MQRESGKGLQTGSWEKRAPQGSSLLNLNRRMGLANSILAGLKLCSVCSEDLALDHIWRGFDTFGEVFELGEFVEEGQGHSSDGAVSLLGDDEFGKAL